MYYAEYRGTRIFSASTGPSILTGLQFSQNFKGPVDVTVRDSDGNVIDMTGWSCSSGIVGGTGTGAGIPTGTPGGPALAAYTAGMTWGSSKFAGTLECNTDEMADFIGALGQKRSRFAYKFLKNDGTERFECSCDITVLAADIESGSSVPAALGPIAFTVDEGQLQKTFAFPGVPADADLQFIKLSGGPQVDFWIVNVNEDDPTQNTVTVTLAANASAGGMNFKAYSLTS